MKINNINNTTPFKRAIVIKTNTTEKYNDPIDFYKLEMCRIINGEKSSIYSKNEAEKIRQFFLEALDDFEINNPVIIEKDTNGKTVLLSGEEALQIKDLKSKVEKGIEIKSKDLNYSPDEIYEFHDKAMTAVRKAVEYREENGTSGKPESEIKIEQLRNTMKTKITYSTYITRFLADVDGNVDKEKGERDFPYIGKNYKNITYDSKELII